jgi:hypothetical protein
MDNKVVFTALVGVIVALLSWNIKTTNALQLQVQRLEIILLDDAFSK